MPPGADFEIEADETPEPPPPAAPTRRPQASIKRTPAPDNLAFTFGDGNGKDDWHTEPLDELEIPDEEFSLKLAPQDEFAPGEGPDDDTTDEEDEEPKVARSKEAEEDEDEEVADGGISLGPVIVFLVLVVSAYAVLAFSLLNNPEWAQQIAQDMPFVGSGTRDRLLSRKVVLQKVEGSYERIKEGKDIFVITGEATNHASVPMSSVQVLARILDSNANAIDERVIFCGSSIPLKLLRDLSLGELSVIGRLKPPKTFLLRPGETAEFMVVFTEMSATVADFSAQVVLAQRQA